MEDRERIDMIYFQVTEGSWMTHVGIHRFCSDEEDSTMRYIDIAGHDDLSISLEEQELLQLWVQLEGVPNSLQLVIEKYPQPYFIDIDSYLTWFFIRKEYNYDRKLH